LLLINYSVYNGCGSSPNAGECRERASVHVCRFEDIKAVF